jgi:hypothetical protein
MNHEFFLLTGSIRPDGRPPAGSMGARLAHLTVGSKNQCVVAPTRGQ